ncbi:hypothetical protein K7640_20345 [Micromonospora sp. PLK6-60]|uniref:hypothetical protein n=1 Tax=Micromonospora sp. PLK6-60 TaxID=2873383 RepID=UPI001CA6E392|nr:hypothetical protein [Micromonospora sp. PLK6-60]MBY8874182.1 hypothetical protein [Micromonospora sp. PLK6-60]
MDLTDLKQVLDERSDGSGEHVLHQVRLHGVRAKVVARRRRRFAAWSACAVLALAGVAAAVAPGPGADGTPTPATSPDRTIEGFPEYAEGARVVAATSAPLAERRIELTMVPRTLDLVVFTRCTDVGVEVTLEHTVRVNGHPLVSGSCGNAGANRPSKWDGLGVVVGRPVTFVMTVTEAAGSATASVTATVGLAIGERIPFDRYPLPPRPFGPLGALDQMLPAGCTEAVCPDAVIIRADAADPTRPVRRTLTWRTLQSVDMVAQTPGLLHLRVNGVEITTGEWWDYYCRGNGMYGDQGGGWKREFGLDPRPGDQVVVEVVPEHLTGAWQVVLSPAES